MSARDVFGIASISAAVTGATAGAFVAWNKVAEVLRSTVRQHRTSISGRQALGLGAGNVAYRHDSVHALYSDRLKPHPDNLAALAAVCRNDVADALGRSQFHVRDEVKASLESNLFLIGAPNSEGLTQPLLGYQPEPGIADSLLLSSAPVDLPYHWVMSRTQVDESAIARRFVAKEGMVERPNWRIEGRERFIPMTDTDGYLAEDYLLVTKVRNYSSPSAFDSGRFIVSIGGTHGTGTRGIELLLRDNRLLAEIRTALGNSTAAFQLVLRVSSIRHSIEHGTVGRKIELASDPVPIPDDELSWREAKRIAQENLRAWWVGQVAERPSLESD